MTKLHSLLLISILSLSSHRNVVSTCQSNSSSPVCTTQSVVTIKSIQSTSCQKKEGAITILYRASGAVEGTITFSATHNRTQKTYSAEVPVAASGTSVEKIGLITGLPAGTYTVTTNFLPTNGQTNLTCLYTCDNIQIKTSPCRLLLSCCKKK